MDLQIHLRQCFMYMANVHSGCFDQPLPVPHHRANCHHLCLRPKSSTQKSYRMQIPGSGVKSAIQG